MRLFLFILRQFLPKLNYIIRASSLFPWAILEDNLIIENNL